MRGENINAICIHGDKKQSERERAITLFSEKKCKVLVATDLASRGLDLPNVLWVINMDMPDNIERYLHRIGRTGRAGMKGTAISLINEKDRGVIKDLKYVLEQHKQEIPPFIYEAA